MSSHIHNILSLGDSYTVGEGVALFESFPYQLVQQLRRTGYLFHSPEIVAKTGWTTFDLADHLIHHKLEEHYDFATLCIGVNNQYRDLPVEDYAEDFEFLLKKAIHFVKGHAQCVMVLSIPDWSATPFASAKNTKKIAEAIDAFNSINANIAFKYDCTYIDITPSTRRQDEMMYTGDGLHYSAGEYGRWSLELADKIKMLIA